MNEQGRHLIEEVIKVENETFEHSWSESPWNNVRSFTEMGIAPETQILSLWPDFGNYGKRFDMYLRKNGFTYNHRQEFWTLMTNFMHNVSGRDSTIGDFSDITEQDLRHLDIFSRKEKRILVRLFATTSKPATHSH